MLIDTTHSIGRWLYERPLSQNFAPKAASLQTAHYCRFAELVG
jgi:hypothetical protein